MNIPRWLVVSRRGKGGHRTPDTAHRTRPHTTSHDRTGALLLLPAVREQRALHAFLELGPLIGTPKLAPTTPLQGCGTGSSTGNGAGGGTGGGAGGGAGGGTSNSPVKPPWR